MRSGSRQRISSGDTPTSLERPWTDDPPGVICRGLGSQAAHLQASEDPFFDALPSPRAYGAGGFVRSRHGFNSTGTKSARAERTSSGVGCWVMRRWESFIIPIICRARWASSRCVLSSLADVCIVRHQRGSATKSLRSRLTSATRVFPHLRVGPNPTLSCGPWRPTKKLVCRSRAGNITARV